MSFENLSMILWRERELLESLLYRLEVEQLVLASGKARWLLQAANDVEQVVVKIRQTEMLRAVASDEVASSIGLEHNTSLRVLAEAAEEPWRTIFLEHRDAFAAVTRDISALSATNRELITAGYRAAREAMMSLEADGADGVASYSPDGSKVTAPQRSAILDRSL